MKILLTNLSSVIFAVIGAAFSLTQIAPLIIDVTKASEPAEQLFKTVDRVSEIDALSDEGLTLETCQGDVGVKDLISLTQDDGILSTDRPEREDPCKQNHSTCCCKWVSEEHHCWFTRKMDNRAQRLFPIDRIDI